MRCIDGFPTILTSPGQSKSNPDLGSRGVWTAACAEEIAGKREMVAKLGMFERLLGHTRKVA